MIARDPLVEKHSSNLIPYTCRESKEFIDPLKHYDSDDVAHTHRLSSLLPPPLAGVRRENLI